MADVEQIFILLTAGLHPEMGAAPLDPLKADRMIRATMDSGAVLVLEVGDILVGSIGLYESDFWYSQESFLTDRWTYVTPEARRVGAGEQLLRGAKTLARSLGKRLALGLHSPNRLEAKMRLYRRHGFYLTAALMMEGLDTEGR